MNEGICMICSRSPKERIPLLINILNLYGIQENKSIYMQSFLLHPSYYVNQLISYLTNTNFKLIESYMFPCTCKSNALKQQKINGQEFVQALEKIRKSKIVISGVKIFPEKDWLDYIFDLENEYQVIIIDALEELLKNTQKNIKQVIRKIEKYQKKVQTQVILLMDEKESTKYQFSNWQISHIDRPFYLKYNSTNHLEDMILKEEEK